MAPGQIDFQWLIDHDERLTYHTAVGQREATPDDLMAQGATFKHYDRYREASKALADYMAAERDQWGKLTRYWRYVREYSLWADVMPERMRKSRGLAQRVPSEPRAEADMEQ